MDTEPHLHGISRAANVCIPHWACFVRWPTFAVALAPNRCRRRLDTPRLGLPERTGIIAWFAHDESTVVSGSSGCVDMRDGTAVHNLVTVLILGSGGLRSKAGYLYCAAHNHVRDLGDGADGGILNGPDKYINLCKPSTKHPSFLLLNDIDKQSDVTGQSVMHCTNIHKWCSMSDYLRIIEAQALPIHFYLRHFVVHNTHR